MNTSSSRLLALVLISFVLAVTSQAAESLSVLLQKGIFAEETEGNLDAAIRIYENIVKEGEANRSLVAQAQYRLGVCHLKKGKKNEAVVEFRRILNEFPKETDLHAKSRERLAELGESASTTIVRPIWPNAESADGGISWDGRYFAFTDMKTGDVALRDLVGNQTRRLTNSSPWSNSDYYAMSFVFSRKGNEIAYLWTDRYERCEIRIASTEKAESRTLLKYTGWFTPQDWSPDGQQLAALVWEPKSQNPALSLVSVATGAHRELRRAGTNVGPSNVRFSPDGKHLAYTRRPNKETPETELYLVSTENGTETRLTNNSADDKLVGWAPNGNGVLFTSDRRGSTDLWFLPISKEGKATSEPAIMRANLGEIQPIGLTEKGAFYYGVSGRPSDLYEAAIDVSTGKVLSSPKEIPSRFSVTKSIGPKRLSPDGHFLAFVRSRGVVSSFHLEDLRTGDIREIAIRNVRTFSYPEWSADSRFVVVHGVSYDLRHGIYLVNGVTGETSVLRHTEPTRYRGDVNYVWLGIHNETVHYAIRQSGQRRVTLAWHDLQNGTKGQQEINLPEGTNLQNGSYALSPDVKSFFYIRRMEIGSGTTNWVAVRRDLMTSREFEFLRSTDQIAFAFDARSTGESAIRSPGLPILMTSWKTNGPATVIGIDVIEDSAKERFRVELPPRSMIWPHWFGGKAHLLFTKVTPNEKDPMVELWAILGEKSEIKNTGLALPWLRIVGTYGENQILFEKIGPQFNEIWVMENFLPTVAAAK